jgi:hypothetical protein
VPQAFKLGIHLNVTGGAIVLLGARDPALVEWPLPHLTAKASTPVLSTSYTASPSPSRLPRPRSKPNTAAWTVLVRLPVSLCNRRTEAQMPGEGLASLGSSIRANGVNATERFGH